MTIRYVKRSRLDTWRLLHPEEAARVDARRGMHPGDYLDGDEDAAWYDAFHADIGGK